MALPARKLSGFHGDRIRPQVLAGFEGIKSFWDSQHNLFSARILPGEYYVACGEEIITTVLGSCVSACIRDPIVGVGGMNHFMLPEGAKHESKSIVNPSARYGTYAMEHMINVILANGGRRERLEIKLFGGGRVLQTMTDIGKRNIEFVRNYLQMEGLPTISEDLGSTHPRKVIYFPFSGRVLVKRLPITDSREIGKVEQSYQSEIVKKPVAGEIDLF
jgi:chemotaxis protein CheD